MTDFRNKSMRRGDEPRCTNLPCQINMSPFSAEKRSTLLPFEANSNSIAGTTIFSDSVGHTLAPVTGSRELASSSVMFARTFSPRSIGQVCEPGTYSKGPASGLILSNATHTAAYQLLTKGGFR